MRASRSLQHSVDDRLMFGWRRRGDAWHRLPSVPAGRTSQETPRRRQQSDRNGRLGGRGAAAVRLPGVTNVVRPRCRLGSAGVAAGVSEHDTRPSTARSSARHGQGLGVQPGGRPVALRRFAVDGRSRCDGKPARCSDHRSDRNAARISSQKSCGCSHAAKCPPRSSRL
jgi:hypothetical protein